MSQHDLCTTYCFPRTVPRIPYYNTTLLYLSSVSFSITILNIANILFIVIFLQYNYSILSNEYHGIQQVITFRSMATVVRCALLPVLSPRTFSDYNSHCHIVYPEILHLRFIVSVHTAFLNFVNC